MNITNQAFQTGKQMITAGVSHATSENPNFHLFLMQCMEKHKSNDWGDVGETDWKNNDAAVIVGERIISAYNLPDNFKSLGHNSRDTKLWIITEWNRSLTTVLFPSEY